MERPGRGPAAAGVHVATGMAVPGIFALAPFDPATCARRHRGRRGRPGPAAGPARPGRRGDGEATTGSRTRGTADPGAAQREREQQERAERTDRFRRLPWVALGLTALALVVAAAEAAGARPPAPCRGWSGPCSGCSSSRPALLVLLLVACLLLRPSRRPGRTGVPEAASEIAVEDRAPAWHGLAMPGIALLAWVLAGGFSSGVILRAAQTLGTPVAAARAAAGRDVPARRAHGLHLGGGGRARPRRGRGG